MTLLMLTAQESPPPLGQLVDVGGYRVHLYCTGQGSPTVVAIGGFSMDWALVRSEVAQFIVVGASGVLVNILGVTALLRAGLSADVSIAGAILISICTNFLLNRRFTFSHSKSGHMPTQFLRYLVSVSFGAMANYLIAIFLLDLFPRLMPQLASLGGIAVATVVNFVALKFIVFKGKHYRPRGSDGGG